MEKYKSKTLLFIAVSSISAILYIFFIYACYPIYYPAEYWIPEMYKIKIAHLEKIEKTIQRNKTIILSGSNALFGFSSKIFSDLTGYPTVNLACHVDLSLPFLKYLALTYAKPGDTVIMPLEFSHYCRKPYSLSSWEKNQLATWGRDFIDIIFSEYRKTIEDHAIRQSFKYPHYIFREPPVRNLINIPNRDSQAMLTLTPYKADYANQYGECLVDKENREIAKDTYFNKKDIDIDSFIFLKNLSNTLENNNIKFYISWPPTIKNYFDLAKNDNHEKIASIISQLNKIDIKVIGIPSTYNFDKSLFF